MTHGDWIALAALFCTIMIGLLGYLRKPAFTTTAHVEDLDRQIARLTDENERLKGDVQRLGNENWSLERRVTFWQDQFRLLKEGKGSDSRSDSDS